MCHLPASTTMLLVHQRRLLVSWNHWVASTVWAAALAVPLIVIFLLVYSDNYRIFQTPMKVKLTFKRGYESWKEPGVDSQLT